MHRNLPSERLAGAVGLGNIDHIGDNRARGRHLSGTAPVKDNIAGRVAADQDAVKDVIDVGKLAVGGQETPDKQWQ